MGSDPTTADVHPDEVQFQSALPHGERRGQVRIVTSDGRVSIRAPAWGATEPPPTKHSQDQVSIRAPAWGATRLKQDSARYQHLFQSALPHGERHYVYPDVLRQCAFQSALPHGERPDCYSCPGCRPGFNPRSRMGSDIRHSRNYSFRVVSIRAPAWGATPHQGHRLRLPGVSIRAPAWGATGSCSTSRHRPLFQSALPHGERPQILRNVAEDWKFQSALPHGERRCPANASSSRVRFQSALPHGERPLSLSQMPGTK